jgi:hypothetical protein
METQGPIADNFAFSDAKGELGSPCDPVRTVASNGLCSAVPALGGREA